MPTPEAIPKLRVRPLARGEIVGSADYVLYWMVAQRRTRWNYALQHAMWHALRLRKPLVVFEPLRAGHRWANDRLHQFVVEGMHDNAERLRAAGITYLPWLERVPGEGRGLLAALAEHACMIVTDEHPCYFLPRMLDAAGEQLAGRRVEAVDGCGLLPLQTSEQAFGRAHDFRRFIHHIIPSWIAAMPSADPLAGVELPRLRRLPARLRDAWAPLEHAALADARSLVAATAIDHAVAAAPARGGSETASRMLDTFVAAKLDRYADDRNEPDDEVQSGLSPWLHFGHVSPHEIVARVLAREDWTPSRLGDARALRGSREGFWGLTPAAEAFLDQVITWRELGFHFCWHQPDYDRYESLPAWARATLADHAIDPREYVYSLAQFESADTHDELWNAAQRQLLSEGRIHNYLRMLWGKKILEWSESPAAALDIMIALNDRWALDGRDPNSYSGIGWVLGRFDRPWGPVRPIFGTIRYMSSDATRRKLGLRGYLARWGAGEPLLRRSKLA